MHIFKCTQTHTRVYSCATECAAPPAGSRLHPGPVWHQQDLQRMPRLGRSRHGRPGAGLLLQQGPGVLGCGQMRPGRHGADAAWVARGRCDLVGMGQVRLGWHGARACRLPFTLPISPPKSNPGLVMPCCWVWLCAPPPLLEHLFYVTALRSCALLCIRACTCPYAHSYGIVHGQERTLMALCTDKSAQTYPLARLRRWACRGAKPQPWGL